MPEYNTTGFLKSAFINILPAAGHLAIPLAAASLPAATVVGAGAAAVGIIGLVGSAITLLVKNISPTPGGLIAGLSFSTAAAAFATLSVPLQISSPFWLAASAGMAGMAGISTVFAAMDGGFVQGSRLSAVFAGATTGALAGAALVAALHSPSPQSKQPAHPVVLGKTTPTLIKPAYETASSPPFLPVLFRG